MEKEISIIIVSWNARDFLHSCLLSIQRTAGKLKPEIIVVDNASDDGSPELVARNFPEVTLIETGCNLGFAAANNRGMAIAKGRYLCLINSDVIVQTDCLQVLLAYMGCNPDVGITGPRILNPDHSLQQSITAFPGLFDSWLQALFLHRLHPFQWLNPGKNMLYTPIVRDVPVLYGMFWMVSRTAWQDVGNLDERFFMYGEDLDWCKRFHAGGYRVVHVPDATAIHHGGGSSRAIPVRSAVQMRKSRILYFSKHHNRLTTIMNWMGMIVASLIRFMLWIPLTLAPLPKTTSVKTQLASQAACLKWLLIDGIALVLSRPRCVSS